MSQGVMFPYELTGTSSVVREAVAQVARAAADDRGVLVTAEPGLDAAAVARAVHATSARRAGPFVTMSCEGASVADLERKLFGAHHRGTATELELVGPAGMLMRAHGGTLFLGSVNELAAPLQRRLARALRDGEVRVQRRSGTVMLDVRVVASRESSVDGSLREDLLR